jgi:hypothetical protein
MKYTLVFLSVLLIATTVSAQSSWTVRGNKTGHTVTITEDVTRSFTVSRRGSDYYGVYYYIEVIGTGWVGPVLLIRDDTGETVYRFVLLSGLCSVYVLDNVPHHFEDTVGHTLKFSLEPPRLTQKRY